jgi:hypothetical protein
MLCICHVFAELSDDNVFLVGDFNRIPLLLLQSVCDLLVKSKIFF